MYHGLLWSAQSWALCPFLETGIGSSSFFCAPGQGMGRGMAFTDGLGTEVSCCKEKPGAASGHGWESPTESEVSREESKAKRKRK